MTRPRASDLIFLVLLLLIGAFSISSAPRGRAADGEGVTPDSRAKVDGYLPDKQAAAYRSAVDGSDSIANVASLTDTITPFSIAGPARRAGRQNLSLSCRFSSAAATATVWVAYYYFDGTAYTLLGMDQSFGGGVLSSRAR